MKQIRAFKRTALAIAVGAVGLMPLAATAQGAGEGLKWRATIYAWLPSIDGSTNFPTSPNSPSINVDSSTVLDNLKMAFMGTLEASSGQWGGLADVMYVDLGNDKQLGRNFSLGPNNTVPGGLDLNADYDLKGWVVTLAGTYSLVSKPAYESRFVFGTRMLNIKQTLDYSLTGNVGQYGLPGRTGTSTVDGTNWDAIVGVKGNYAFTEDRRWFIPYYADIGTGQSKLTWQALAGVGYNFDWGSVVAAYRYLDYQFKDG
jgi:hypothetical protein